MKSNTAKCIVILCLLLFFGQTNAQKQNEINILTNKLFNKTVSEKVNRELLENSIKTIRPDGSWADINYDTVTFRFQAGMHLTRLVNMALAYRKQGSAYLDSDQLFNQIMTGVDFFFKKRPISLNWWNNDIGSPTDYMKILLLLKGKMDTNTLRHYSSYLEDKTGNQAHKGKNRTWVSAVTIHKGCIEDNYELLKIGFNSIASTIEIASIQGEEGIKMDNSIHQHRPQLYSGGYGMGYVADIADFIDLADSTSFSELFTPNKRKILSDVMLGGQQLFGYRKSIDFGTIGRNISRKNGMKNISPELLDLMAKIEPQNAQAYSLWKNHINGAAFPAVGNKYFWKSDIMTQHGANYYMSAKVISTRTNGTEMLNQENLKGHNLPLGATNIMTSGNEYDNIFPIWDWTRIPGTTAVMNQSSVLLNWYFFGSNNYAGGVSNGKNGVIAFEHAYNGIEALKSYFFIGDAMLCLGTGISACKTQAVVTSVNQCFANGEIYINESGNKSPLVTEKQTSSNINWVYHDHVGYIFPLGGNVTIQKVMQTGSWKLINESGSEKKISQDVFSLWINHGDEPRNANYCYIVLPHRTLNEFEVETNNHGFVILRNDVNVQAVKNEHLNTYALVFYNPATVDLGNSLTISSDRKSIVLIEINKDSFEISVADPLYTQVEVNLTINKKLDGKDIQIKNKQSTIHFNYPQGEFIGKCVTRLFNQIN